MGRTGQQMRSRTTKAIASNSGTGRRQRPAPTRSARLRYAFDNSMSRGTPALVGWLALITLALIVVFALIVTLFNLRDGSNEGFWRELLQALFHALDPGTVGGDGAAPWRFVLTMLVLTIAGLFIVSALIGVIAAGIDARIAELQRGRSTVLERDHTVILGWSEAVFTILAELAVANESRRRPVVVILADRDKVEMEEAVREKVADLRGTRVICRSGSPIDVGDLAIASPVDARSIIVLAPEVEEPDSEVIKTLLALTHDGDDGPPIVAEIQDPDNLEAARMVGKDRTVVVDKRETVSRLIVQTSRQSGAAAVYTELFDFDGDEIYFHDKHGLADATYAHAQLSFEHVTVMGLLNTDGSATLNPPPDTVIGERSLIVAASDDAAVGAALSEPLPVDESVIRTSKGTGEAPSTILLIGWNRGATTVVRELDAYASPGSRLTVLTEFGEPALPTLENLTSEVVRGRTADRATLAAHLRDGVDQVIVLCYSDQLPPQQADARTLVTLLHVRDLVGSGDNAPAVVSELLDDRNRALAEVANVDDVIVSDKILSLILTQLAENAGLEPVFTDLLDADGSEIYLRPAEWYVEPGNEVSVATVVAAASRRGETAIGYRSVAAAAEGLAPAGVFINPAKSRTFQVAPGDRVVVLAED